MICIFSSPKSFADPHIALIQRNAIQSWTLLKPQCDIILMGNDAGTAEIASEFHLKHVANVECKANKPIVSSLFKNAEINSDGMVLMYLNADIILLKDFLLHVNHIITQMAGNPFFAIGQRCNVEINAPINFNDSNWENELKDNSLKYGRYSGPFSIDYFIFTKGLWKEIPPFTIGRVAYDNWLIYEARRLRCPIIDLTPSTCVIHQHHEQFVKIAARPIITDKHSYDKFMWDRRLSPEAIAQINMAGKGTLFGISDSTHIFAENKIQLRKVTFSRFHRELKLLFLLSERNPGKLLKSIFPENVKVIYRSIRYFVKNNIHRRS